MDLLFFQRQYQYYLILMGFFEMYKIVILRSAEEVDLLKVVVKMKKMG